jgi:hypothetical protein
MDSQNLYFQDFTFLCNLYIFGLPHFIISRYCSWFSFKFRVFTIPWLSTTLTFRRCDFSRLRFWASSEFLLYKNSAFSFSRISQWITCSKVSALSVYQLSHFTFAGSLSSQLVCFLFFLCPKGALPDIHDRLIYTCVSCRLRGCASCK